jgi:hypothetical protein
MVLNPIRNTNDNKKYITYKDFFSVQLDGYYTRWVDFICFDNYDMWGVIDYISWVRLVEI